MFQTYKQAYNPTINPFLSRSIVNNIKDSLRYNHLTDYHRIERFKNVKMILARANCDKNAEYYGDDYDDDYDDDPYNYMKTGLYILSLSSFAYYFYSKRNRI